MLETALGSDASSLKCTGMAVRMDCTQGEPTGTAVVKATCLSGVVGCPHGRTVASGSPNSTVSQLKGSQHVGLPGCWGCRLGDPAAMCLTDLCTRLL